MIWYILATIPVGVIMLVLSVYLERWHLKRKLNRYTREINENYHSR
jgi:hypothetical protein